MVFFWKLIIKFVIFKPLLSFPAIWRKFSPLFLVLFLSEFLSNINERNFGSNVNPVYSFFFFNLKLFGNSEGKLQAVDYTKMGAYTNQLLQSVEPLVNCIVAIQNEIQFK